MLCCSDFCRYDISPTVLCSPDWNSCHGIPPWTLIFSEWIQMIVPWPCPFSENLTSSIYKRVFRSVPNVRHHRDETLRHTRRHTTDEPRDVRWTGHTLGIWTVESWVDSPLDPLHLFVVGRVGPYTLPSVPSRLTYWVVVRVRTTSPSLLSQSW